MGEWDSGGFESGFAPSASLSNDASAQGDPEPWMERRVTGRHPSPPIPNQGAWKWIENPSSRIQESSSLSQGQTHNIHSNPTFNSFEN